MHTVVAFNCPGKKDAPLKTQSFRRNRALLPHYIVGRQKRQHP